LGSKTDDFEIMSRNRLTVYAWNLKEMHVRASIKMCLCASFYLSYPMTRFE